MTVFIDYKNLNTYNLFIFSLENSNNTILTINQILKNNFNSIYRNNKPFCHLHHFQMIHLLWCHGDVTNNTIFNYFKGFIYHT